MFMQLSGFVIDMAEALAACFLYFVILYTSARLASAAFFKSKQESITLMKKDTNNGV